MERRKEFSIASVAHSSQHCVMMCSSWLSFVVLALLVSMTVGWQNGPTSTFGRTWASQLSKAMISSSLLLSSQSVSLPVRAADDLPSLERCFNAVRKELDPKNGESLNRIKKDIDGSNWDDLKLFTREYDAGFRGGVLKSAWKQLGDAKGKGIQVTNSFTFDLIALNKAARNEDKVDAYSRLEQVRQDLTDFLALEQK